MNERPPRNSSGNIQHIGTDYFLFRKKKKKKKKKNIREKKKQCFTRLRLILFKTRRTRLRVIGEFSSASNHGKSRSRRRVNGDKMFVDERAPSSCNVPRRPWREKSTAVDHRGSSRVAFIVGKIWNPRGR